MTDYPIQDVEHLDADGAIALSITAQESSEGGASLRRLIPAPGCDRVGPFISFEDSWPDISTRPEGVHLAVNAAAETAAISYVFHAGSVGEHGRAGEREDVHCVNCWVAIPADTDQAGASLQHIDIDAIPVTSVAGVTIRVILGEAFGKSSALLPDCPVILLDCALAVGDEFKLPGDIHAPAAYVVCGRIKINGRKYSSGAMAVCAPGWPVKLLAESESLVIVLGGNNPRLARQSPRWDW